MYVIQSFAPANQEDLFVDGLTMSAASSEDDVRIDLIKFSSDLENTMLQHLQASIAVDKSTVMASTPQLARDIRAILNIYI